MNRAFTLATIAATAVAGLALLAVWPLKPVQATTFPGLTLIYTAAGVIDYASSPTFIGTSVPCVNQSGTTATVRWRFFNDSGVEVGAITQTLANGQMIIGSTGNGTSLYVETGSANNFQGRVVVYSTQSAVFCTASAGSSASYDFLTDLHMIRFNSHPGAVE